MHIDFINEELRSTPAPLAPGHLSSLSHRLKLISDCLREEPSPSSLQDAFRLSRGFPLLLNCLKAASGSYDPTKITRDGREALLAVVSEALLVLASAFRNHEGNQRYFRHGVDGCGWGVLEQRLAEIGLGGPDTDSWSQDRFFSVLLAFATDQPHFESLIEDVKAWLGRDKGNDSEKANEPSFAASRVVVSSSESPNSSSSSASSSSPVARRMKPNSESKQAPLLNELDQIIHASLDESDAVAALIYPDIILAIFTFWRALPRMPGSPSQTTALIVIAVFRSISTCGLRDISALRSTGLLSRLLPLVFDQDTPLLAPERELAEQLCEGMMIFGVGSLEDAKYLACSNSPAVGEFMLRAMKDCYWPPFVEFDLRKEGYSSIESSIITQFQDFPSSSSQGYTFTAWAYFANFDVKNHTTIFGAFDSTHTCYILAYLEQDSQNFILQTSAKAKNADAAVRFKLMKFEPHRWYHIALVHRKSRAFISSKASLYVNGEFVQEKVIAFPTSPPITAANPGAVPPRLRPNPVQAFLGTPQALSSQLGPNLVSTIWDLASFHLINDVLSDDIISLHCRLGPRYSGNFQDSLGDFQTYESSTALTIRNELRRSKKDNGSNIRELMQNKACNLMPESRIIFSMIPSGILEVDYTAKAEGYATVLGFSQQAYSKLLRLTKNGVKPLAINAAIPSIEAALTSSHGAAVLGGGLTIVKPQSLDNVMWRLGGCTGVLLSFIERATSKEAILGAVELLFASVKDNWRNSQAMETDNGYAILAVLLRDKLGTGSVTFQSASTQDSASLSPAERDQLSFQLLGLVLEFVGYMAKAPENSMIINPLAYRVLLVDFDLWRKSALQTQKAYYRQFVVFALKSRYSRHNSEKLGLMRKSISATFIPYY